MQVLVATDRSQGLRSDDVDECVDGELVWLPPQCGRGPNCSCTSSFTGCSSRGITTTARVHELPGMTRTQLLRAIRAGMCRDCWPGSSVYRAAESLLDVAAAFPVGTIVQRTSDGGVRARFCETHQALYGEHDD